MPDEVLDFHVTATDSVIWARWAAARQKDWMDPDESKRQERTLEAVLQPNHEL
ncbi:MAG: hypothetical protein OXI10_07925 [Gammaproteobacteria bacterium]|nr:hypothetical protein [Gammaproteobacteria bacterium]